MALLNYEPSGLRLDLLDSLRISMSEVKDAKLGTAGKVFWGAIALLILSSLYQEYLGTFSESQYRSDLVQCANRAEELQSMAALPASITGSLDRGEHLREYRELALECLISYDTWRKRRKALEKLNIQNR